METANAGDGFVVLSFHSRVKAKQFAFTPAQPSLHKVTPKTYNFFTIYARVMPFCYTFHNDS